MEEKCRMHIREKDLISVSVDELSKYLQESGSMYPELQQKTNQVMKGLSNEICNTIARQTSTQ